MYDLTGTTALVTGAAQGIGLGIARELLRVGSRVVIADRNFPQALIAAVELKKERSECMPAELDVTDAASVNRCIQSALTRFSRIDILVNNAGIHCEVIGQLSTVEDFNRCFDVNLFGIWRVTQALVPHFRANRAGKIINVASVNGRLPWADTPAYSASKAAVINLTQSLAIKLGGDNINVNAVCPGGVMTMMADAFTRDRAAMQKEMIRNRQLKRPLLPEDIGGAVVFFASLYARNITGQALNVDGGAVMN